MTTEKTKSPILKRIVSLIFLLLWMGLIFYFSSQTADDSTAVSDGLIKTIVKFLFPDISAVKLSGIVTELQFIVRKGAHLSLYTILGILSFLTFVTYRIHISLRITISAFVGILYAASDELHQTFIKGRSGELRDILIDSVGVLCGIALSFLIYLLRNAIKRRKAYPMKKKQYAELCEALKLQLRKAREQSAELNDENNALKKEISLRNAELSQLKREIENLKSSIAESVPAYDEIPLEDEVETNDIPQTEKMSESEPEKKEIPQVILPNDMEYGAEIIGKTVMLATECCNTLSAEPSENTKELINLILGRGEVAKAEILKIVSSPMDSQSKISSMDEELRQSEDYFKSVMAQK